jgi:hypothetical protein
MKDVLLQTELNKNYDLLINFDTPNDKVLSILKDSHIKKKVIVNAEDSFFDLSLSSAFEKPSEMLNFVTTTLEKINLYD